MPLETGSTISQGYQNGHFTPLCCFLFLFLWIWCAIKLTDALVVRQLMESPLNQGKEALVRWRTSPEITITLGLHLHHMISGALDLCFISDRKHEAKEKTWWALKDLFFCMATILFFLFCLIVLQLTRSLSQCCVINSRRSLIPVVHSYSFHFGTPGILDLKYVILPLLLLLLFIIITTLIIT